MYKGTIKRKSDYIAKARRKEQMLQIEQVEHNGVITEQYKVKTVDFKNDKNIRVRDFDIRNLMAIGAFDSLKTTQLHQSIDKIQAGAETANEIIEKIDIIKSLEENE